MTKAEYLEAYARRHKLSAVQLVRDGVRVIPCTCNVRGCQGWSVDWSAKSAPMFVPAPQLVTR
jgi:hypothetical protein